MSKSLTDNRALLLDGLTPLNSLSFPAAHYMYIVDFVHASSGPCARPYPLSAR
ncbi:hypothetical protein K435DRAFT_781245 [Dendrothele bispora CBS 962.96]|uniref:Uncharacterized protein n=1 Tax=Dendrothele bispora (strain CBS 962.96) TaxID=1314807 RepID=A0A4S8LNA5_DENBC|nr:hypothetical protein K435DRAFT_781245 [Dendrothele bispora CBS 962.96]